MDVMRVFKGREIVCFSISVLVGAVRLFFEVVRVRESAHGRQCADVLPKSGLRGLSVLIESPRVLAESVRVFIKIVREL